MHLHRVLFVVSEENYTARYLRSSAQPNANSTTPLTASTGTGQFSWLVGEEADLQKIQEKS